MEYPDVLGEIMQYVRMVTTKHSTIVSIFSALVGCMVYIIPNESFTLQIQYICMYMQLFLIQNIDMNSDRIVIGNRLQNSCSEYIRTHFSDINSLVLDKYIIWSP